MAAQGETEYAKQLAACFKTTPEALVQERQKRKASWGQLTIAHEIARSSGQPMSEIFAQRDQGLGWGKIAKQNGVDLGQGMCDAEARAKTTGAKPAEGVPPKGSEKAAGKPKSK